MIFLDQELEHVVNLYDREGVKVCNPIYKNVFGHDDITRLGNSLLTTFNCEYSELISKVSDMFGKKYKSGVDLNDMRVKLYAEMVDNKTCLTKVQYEKETFPGIKFFFPSETHNTSMYRQNYVSRWCELRALYADYQVFKAWSQDIDQVRAIIEIAKEAKRLSKGSQSPPREYFLKELFKIGALSVWLGNPFLFRLTGCWINLEELNAEDFILNQEQSPDTFLQTANTDETGLSEPQTQPQQEIPSVVAILPEKDSEAENNVSSKKMFLTVNTFASEETTPNVIVLRKYQQDEESHNSQMKNALIFSLVTFASCFIAFGIVGCVKTIYVEVGRDFLKKLKIIK
ncbi:hypothetical protein RF11_02138 [Thelohanellus kitauei]|uniref:Uncharacterized protein n=1 Tax=Thelohanellus kitauei TaxID=669202 RepID=A0A0C2IV00_THEKT|nr:hypothetical protein RF11_02138 [Thelohanellus kitauei]